MLHAASDIVQTGRAEIVTDVLEEPSFTTELGDEVREAWNSFISKAETRELAGEAIYTAIFESAPALQSLFKTPKAVQAMKFMNGIHGMVLLMGSGPGLKEAVESLGFQHLYLDVTPARVAVFRDAILDLLEFELGRAFRGRIRNGLSDLLNYIGGGIIFVRTHYAKRLQLLQESWATANQTSEEHNVLDLLGSASDVGSDSTDAKKTRGKRGASPQASRDNDAPPATVGLQLGSQTLPNTFRDMFRMSSAVMGLVDRDWMDEVLASFDTIVTNVTSSERLKEEADVLALKIANVAPDSSIDLGEFKACMLAALRSLLPKIWTTDHEVAWSWMWDNVAKMLEKQQGKPQQYQKALARLDDVLDEAQWLDVKRGIFVRFFALAPVGQDYFKQSNARLQFIAGMVFQMTHEVFKAPRRSVIDISALGLRHVGYGIPIELFAPFVTSCIEVLAQFCSDDDVLDAFRWSLGLLSKILVRTITEGSTVVMKAINANSTKLLRKAIDCAPRGERALWLLLVQVGSQSISPLAWAIDSGSMDVADAIIKDLLTIRADRESYYYGAADLFKRHPDIVKRLCQEAPMLLPSLLEGLVWRSHRPKNGLRRVNYYVKHLLVCQDGSFSDSLKWISATGDPAIISNPIVVRMSDTLWNGVVHNQFIYTKLWNIVSVVVFMLSQGILPKLIMDSPGDRHEGISYCIFVGRLFIYVLGMGKLGYIHASRLYHWSRREMDRIFKEIDQDGNGDIDWEEFMEAMVTFKNLVKENIVKAISVLKEDGEKVSVEIDTVSTDGDKNMARNLSLMLFLSMVVMCSHEPMLWCVNSDDWPTSQCGSVEPLLFRYSVFSMCSMVVHWLMLIDLAVFSTEISAFLLVVGHVLKEVRQFLMALTFLLLVFGSSISILCRDCTSTGGEFSDLGNAMITFFAITVGLYQGDFRDMEADPLLLVMVLVFITCSGVLLLNLLVAQINLSYEFIATDMVGFARLNRANLIVDAMNYTSKSRWRKFMKSMSFDNKLEFDEGDLGLPGGVSVLEPAKQSRVNHELIKRFGGSTSRDAPWPEDKASLHDTDARCDSMEASIHKAMKRIARYRSVKGENLGGDNSHGSHGRMESMASE